MLISFLRNKKMWIYVEEIISIVDPQRSSGKTADVEIFKLDVDNKSAGLLLKST